MNIEHSSITHHESVRQTTVEPQYLNPTPVVVMIIPVRDIDPDTGGERTGVIAIRRTNEQGAGKLALPGGYLEYEDWRSGGLRETSEEAGFIPCDPEKVTLLNVESVESGKRLIIFASTPLINRDDIPPYVTTNETSERVILYRPTELAFSSHTTALARFFQEQHAAEGTQQELVPVAHQNSLSDDNFARENLSPTLRQIDLINSDAETVDDLLDMYLPNQDRFHEVSLDCNPLNFIHYLSTIRDSEDIKLFCLDARTVPLDEMKAWLHTFEELYNTYHEFEKNRDRYGYVPNPKLFFLTTEERKDILPRLSTGYETKILVSKEEVNSGNSIADIVVNELRSSLRFLFDPAMIRIPPDAKRLS